MARTNLTPTEVTAAGVALPATAGIADGHKYDNRGEEILVIKNTGAGAHTVTVVTPRTVGGLDIEDQENTIAAGATEVMGPFDPGTFNQPSGADRGKVFVNYDASPGELSVGVLKVRKAG